MVNTERSKIAKRNGKLARGRKTEEGLQKSAQNSLQHGVYAAKPPLAGSDDWDTYEATKQALTQQFEPELATEFIAIQQATQALIRLHRLYRAESAIIEKQLHERENQRLQAELAKVRPPDDLALLLKKMSGSGESTPEQQVLIDDLEAQLEARSRVQFDDDVVIVNDAKQLRFQREERHLQNILDRNLAKLEESKKRRQNSYVTQLEAEIQPN